jgi:ribosomal protein S18 acetylase RimI-like enzyme
MLLKAAMTASRQIRGEGTLEQILSVGEFTVHAITHDQLASTLEVYKQCEDFLSLGPVPTASMAMVLADIEHSRQNGGTYCGIWRHRSEVGVLDFNAKAGPRTAFLSLLMIAKPYRNQGIGTSVLEALVTHLRATYRARVLKSGVQVNNPLAIAFWRKHGFDLDSTARQMHDGTTVYSMSKVISRDVLRSRPDDQKRG